MYLIDGHNLIPKIPGLSLRVIDDEEQLIALLKEYCLRRRKKVEVYFDNAPPGFAQTRSYGNVIAHFVRQGLTADEAIRRRLKSLKKSARNWTVVSSDQAVLAAAHEAHARTMLSDDFARDLNKIPREISLEPGKKSESELSDEEVQKWLKFFGKEDE